MQRIAYVSWASMARCSILIALFGDCGAPSCMPSPGFVASHRKDHSAVAERTIASTTPAMRQSCARVTCSHRAHLCHTVGGPKRVRETASALGVVTTTRGLTGRGAPAPAAVAPALLREPGNGQCQPAAARLHRPGHRLPGARACADQAPVLQDGPQAGPRARMGELETMPMLHSRRG